MKLSRRRRRRSLASLHDHTVLTTLHRHGSPPKSLPPPQQLLQSLAKAHTHTRTRARKKNKNHASLPHSRAQMEAPPSPTSHERAEVLASSFSAPEISVRLLPLVILMSTPGGPLPVTQANAMATSHANMPRRHDPSDPCHLKLELAATRSPLPTVQRGPFSSAFCVEPRSERPFLSVTFLIPSRFPND